MKTNRPLELPFNWDDDIAPRLEIAEDINSGNTHARRSVIYMDDGMRIFVKAGTDALTNGWIKKEIEVYRLLCGSGYPYIPDLLGVNEDETAMATEFLGEERFSGYSEDSLRAIFEAQEALKSYKKEYLESAAASMDAVEAFDDKWPRILTSEAIEILNRELSVLGSGKVIGKASLTNIAGLNKDWSLRTDTLTHQDIRSDNFGYDPRARSGKLIDWNWLCMGDPDLDTTSLLIDVYKTGLDPYSLFPERYYPRTIAYLMSFWIDSLIRTTGSTDGKTITRRTSQAKSVEACKELLDRHGL